MMKKIRMVSGLDDGDGMGGVGCKWEDRMMKKTRMESIQMMKMQ